MRDNAWWCERTRRSMRLVLLFDFLHDEKTGIKEPIHTVDETALFAARKATGNGAGDAPCEKMKRVVAQPKPH